MHRTWLALSAIVALLAFSAAPVPAATLKPRFEELRSALAARKSIAELRLFFSTRFFNERKSIFTHEFLDDIVGFKAEPRNFHETVRGKKGCLAYAVPYSAEAPGDWVELSEFSFKEINGRWVITHASHSISATYNFVESEHLCHTLGWPWKHHP
ncbi:hypothetical protein C7S18_06165 [Ahniella affigens]|uniref:DUF4440 domain-containing protein n=1 Tax=Ahniella affigens TaxID=2021234 RepID=A0A2P1PPN6_9GAMM|nr:hypothetical protein [Ahniella affigens]AVP96810.1 hypothetical protein C7S18_06165 [Ahniella affigens]